MSRPYIHAWDRPVIYSKIANPHAMAFEKEFYHLSMEDFSNALAYFFNVSRNYRINSRTLVRRTLMIILSYNLFSGVLHIARLVHEFDKLLLFLLSRSMHTLQEVDFAKQAAIGSTAIMVVGSSHDTDESSHSYNNGGKKQQYRNNHHGKKRWWWSY